MWCGLGSEAVCLFLCTKCAAYFPCKKGARDRPAADSPIVSRDNPVNVNTTDATDQCFGTSVTARSEYTHLARPHETRSMRAL